jgi:hypothetical protein
LTAFREAPEVLHYAPHGTAIRIDVNLKDWRPLQSISPTRTAPVPDASRVERRLPQ